MKRILYVGLNTNHHLGLAAIGDKLKKPGSESPADVEGITYLNNNQNDAENVRSTAQEIMISGENSSAI